MSVVNYEIPAQYFDRLETIYLRVAASKIANALAESLAELLGSVQDMSTIHHFRGTSLLVLQENLNAVYFSCRDSLRTALAGMTVGHDDTPAAKAQLQRDFDAELRRACTALANGLSEEYNKIAETAVNRIHEIVFSSGEETLIAEIRSSGPYDLSRLDRLVEAQTESCFKIIDNATAQWTVELSPTDRNASMRSLRVHLAGVADTENSALTKGKRKGTPLASTYSVSPTSGSDTQQQKDRAAEWARAQFSKGGGATSKTKTEPPAKKRNEAVDVDEAPFDVVKSAIERARQQEEQRKADAIAKLATSAGGRKKK
jgi:hypothetical protein